MQITACSPSVPADSHDGGSLHDPVASLIRNSPSLPLRTQELGNFAQGGNNFPKAHSGFFSGHMGESPGPSRAMADEGHLYRWCPCGTHKQIFHSINLHLFAHPCCQRLLAREAANAQWRQSGVLGWVDLTMLAAGPSAQVSNIQLDLKIRNAILCFL